MKTHIELQIPLIYAAPKLPEMVLNFPRYRYVGSKFPLLPWIHEMLSDFDFNSATDTFSGSDVVSYLFKAMGKQVRANVHAISPAHIRHLKPL